MCREVWLGLFFLQKTNAFKWGDFFFYQGSSKTSILMKYKKYTLVNVSPLKGIWKLWPSTGLFRLEKDGKLQLSSGLGVEQPFKILAYDPATNLFFYDYWDVHFEGTFVPPELSFPPFDEAFSIELPVDGDPCSITQLPEELKAKALTLLEKIHKSEGIGKLLLVLKTRLFPLLPPKTQKILIRNVRRYGNFPPAELLHHLRRYLNCLEDDVKQLLIEQLV